MLPLQTVPQVGLSLERREERPRRKSGDQLTFRVGSLRPGPGLAVIRAGDVFLLADTSWSQEDVVRDFLLDSRQLLQPAYSPARLNMSRLGPSKLSSLTQTCSKLLKEKTAASREVVLAHLSPGPGQSWSLLSSLLATCGLEAVLLLPAAAREAGLSDSAVAGAWSAALAVVTASQASLEQFLEVGGWGLVARLLQGDCCPLTVAAVLAHVSGDSGTALLFPDLLQTLLLVLEADLTLSSQCLQTVLETLQQLLGEDNPCLEYNLLVLQSSDLVQAVIQCHRSLARAGLPLPLQSLRQVLVCLPPSAFF